MKRKRPERRGDDRSPIQLSIGRLGNAAESCIAVLRRWIVFANAPAVGFEDSISVEAIRNDLNAGRAIGSKSPLTYLLIPLQQCVEKGTEALAEVPNELLSILPSRFAEEIDPWSDNCHEAIIEIARSLLEGIRHIEPGGTLFEDQRVFEERKLAIMWFVEHEWHFRGMRTSKIAKQIQAEQLILRQATESETGDRQLRPRSSAETAVAERRRKIVAIVETALIRRPQLLARFKFLSTRVYATRFSTLEKQEECWRGPGADVARGLRALRDALNVIDGAPSLMISEKNQTAILNWPE